MKLQKLCYYAQGYYLATGKELFPDEFQAWQHGPVNYDLYTKYKNHQWRQILDEISSTEIEEREHIKNVVAAYGRYDGAALSTMTHRETPWLAARNGLPEDAGCDEVISKDAMAAYFSAKLRSNGED
jgi:uncharacterized phage-associated protein